MIPAAPDFQPVIDAINRRDFATAHRLCVAMLKALGEHPWLYFYLGIINTEVGQINKATQLFSKALELEQDPEFIVYLIKCHALKGDMQQALRLSKRVPVTSLSSPLALDTMGVAMSRVGLHQQALPYFDQALRMETSNPNYYYNHGVSCKFAGDFEKARDSFERAIALKPDFSQAHFALADLGGITPGNNHIARLEALLSEANQVDAKLHLAHALAKEYEALKNYQQAFEVLEQAKSAKRTTLGNQNQFKDIFAWLKSSGQITELNQGNTSSRPIFVMGMPRSGTTLVERILTSHSLVASGGELQDFGVAVKELTQTPSNMVLDVETMKSAESLNFTELGQRYLARTEYLTQGMDYLVDKLPFNFFYVGLIRRALPNAKIVCLMRNGMDTCIGNYRQLFSINSPYYAYAYSLTEIGEFYLEFKALAEYWHQQFPDAVYLQNYEDLVRQPEQQIKTLLQFCQLPWEDACLHVEKNQKPVSTASKVQVREPINDRSVGRWRNYAGNTQALQELLGQSDH